MIGKLYDPYDNSYCINVRTGESALLTKGVCDEDERCASFTIVCEPYKEKIYFCGPHIETFVNVKSSKTGNIYRTLFFNWRVL